MLEHCRGRYRRKRPDCLKGTHQSLKRKNFSFWEQQTTRATADTISSQPMPGLFGRPREWISPQNPLPIIRLELRQIISGSDAALVTCQPARFDSDITNGARYMPRLSDPHNEAARARTERWRARRRASGRPEVSIVDRAIAASTAVFFNKAFNAEPSMPQPSALDIVAGAQRILVECGYDKRAANGDLKRRLTRRSDLSSLAKIVQTMPEGS